MSVTINTVYRAIHESLHTGISLSGGAKHYNPFTRFCCLLIEKINQLRRHKETITDTGITDKEYAVAPLIAQLIDPNNITDTIRFSFQIMDANHPEDVTCSCTIRRTEDNAIEIRFKRNDSDEEIVFKEDNHNLGELRQIARFDKLSPFNPYLDIDYDND